LSFGEILDQMRRDLGVCYLGENLQASQIAWLLGFHQPSAFSHACRRWTGKSPLQFRPSDGCDKCCSGFELWLAGMKKPAADGPLRTHCYCQANRSHRSFRAVQDLRSPPNESALLRLS
jgi:hypothetical protein